MHEKQSSGDRIQTCLAQVRSLRRRHIRDQQGCFWIEGIRHFVEAYDANLEFLSVLYSPILLKSDLAEMLVRRLAARDVPRVKVTPEQFRSIHQAQRASGMGAIVKQHWTPLRQAEPARGLAWLVAQQIRSPGNLGTILRTAEAVGVGGVIFIGPECDPFDPAVVRAGMGGLFHLPLIRTTLAELKRWLGRHHVTLVGLSPDADRLWTDLPAIRPIALAVGEERRGLSPELRSLCHTKVRLPMAGRADSLNVGVATGVMLYELLRQHASLESH